MLTLETLKQKSEKTVALPLFGDEIKVRRINGAEYRSALPALPPEAETWRPEEFAARRREWLQDLSAQDVESRRGFERDASYRIVALASIEPVLTLEQARLLGPDAEAVAVEILQFSGLIGRNSAEPTEGASGG